MHFAKNVLVQLRRDHELPEECTSSEDEGWRCKCKNAVLDFYGRRCRRLAETRMLEETPIWKLGVDVTLHEPHVDLGVEIGKDTEEKRGENGGNTGENEGIKGKNEGIKRENGGSEGAYRGRPVEKQSINGCVSRRGILMMKKSSLLVCIDENRKIEYPWPHLHYELVYSPMHETPATVASESDESLESLRGFVTKVRQRYGKRDRVPSYIVLHRRRRWTWTGWEESTPSCIHFRDPDDLTAFNLLLFSLTNQTVGGLESWALTTLRYAWRQEIAIRRLCDVLLEPPLQENPPPHEQPVSGQEEVSPIVLRDRCLIAWRVLMRQLAAWNSTVAHYSRHRHSHVFTHTHILLPRLEATSRRDYIVHAPSMHNPTVHTVGTGGEITREFIIEGQGSTEEEREVLLRHRVEKFFALVSFLSADVLPIPAAEAFLSPMPPGSPSMATPLGSVNGDIEASPLIEASPPSDAVPFNEAVAVIEAVASNEAVASPVRPRSREQRSRMQGDALTDMSVSSLDVESGRGLCGRGEAETRAEWERLAGTFWEERAAALRAHAVHSHGGVLRAHANEEEEEDLTVHMETRRGDMETGRGDMETGRGDMETGRGDMNVLECSLCRRKYRVSHWHREDEDDEFFVHGSIVGRFPGCGHFFHVTCLLGLVVSQMRRSSAASDLCVPCPVCRTAL